MPLVALDWKFLWTIQTKVLARRRLPSSSWLAKMPLLTLRALSSFQVNLNSISHATLSELNLTELTLREAVRVVLVSTYS
jgi:hypothetical protein